jgi:hypothetical protein
MKTFVLAMSIPEFPLAAVNDEASDELSPAGGARR